MTGSVGERQDQSCYLCQLPAKVSACSDVTLSASSDARPEGNVYYAQSIPDYAGKESFSKDRQAVMQELRQVVCLHTSCDVVDLMLCIPASVQAEQTSMHRLVTNEIHCMTCSDLTA